MDSGRVGGIGGLSIRISAWTKHGHAGFVCMSNNRVLNHALNLAVAELSNVTCTKQGRKILLTRWNGGCRHEVV